MHLSAHSAWGTPKFTGRRRRRWGRGESFFLLRSEDCVFFSVTHPFSVSFSLPLVHRDKRSGGSGKLSLTISYSKSQASSDDYVGVKNIIEY